MFRAQREMDLRNSVTYQSTMADITRVSVKEQDFLDQDPPLRGQHYVCLSFINPEDVVLKKDAAFFQKFLGSFSTDVTVLLENIGEKFKDVPELVDMVQNLKVRYDYLWDAKALQDEFGVYKAMNSEQLEKDYLVENNYQTTMRGIKVRGVFESLPEAQNRASFLKKHDGKFNIYVAEVGCWCPWSPNPLEIQDQEYAETELNTLVKKYKENQLKQAEFQKERQELMINNAKTNTKPDETAAIKESSVSKSDPESSQTFVLNDKDDPWLESKNPTVTP